MESSNGLRQHYKPWNKKEYYHKCYQNNEKEVLRYGQLLTEVYQVAFEPHPWNKNDRSMSEDSTQTHQM